GRGLSAIDKSLQRDVDKQRMTADEKQEIVSRIKDTSEINEVASAELLVEAITENPAVKSDLFARLDQMVGAETILPSNTSSISITKLAAATNRPDRFIGMHFMNPVPVMKLVEVIRGVATSDATYRATHELVLALGKIPVEVNDSPGFVSNRVLMHMINVS